MADYIVSARKYRPMRFSDMLGQEQVATTLKNAIRTGHLAHSFLFCGPRGVGKTTAARILAKTINCENIGTDFEACGTCSSCTSFQQNASFNIHELDAASNNSVDDMRMLVEQVRFPPQSGKYKIYIIDEVHMLSASAFNAFLKTLEEPPAHCKFILATTEKNKILPTILSRCQIFDFRRIGIETIVGHLKNICTTEGTEADEEALHIIAQKADGGMRDALSMFDRLSNFGDGKLTYSSVLENLNVLDYDYFFKVTDALLSEDVVNTFTWLDEILKKGFEGDDFVLGLCEHFRNLLFCKDLSTLKLLEVSEALRQKYATQAALSAPDFLVNCLKIGNEADVQYKQSKNKRLTVEMALIKMCYVNAMIQQEGAESKKKLSNSTNTQLPNPPAQQKTFSTTESSAATVVKEPAFNPEKNEIPPKKDAAPPVVALVKSKKLLTANTITQQGADAIKEEPKEKPYMGEVYILNQENLLLLWNSFAQDLPEENVGMKRLFNTFKPILNSKLEIELTVSSDLQKTQFEGLQNAIIHYVGQRTGANVSLIIVANKQDTGSKKPYSPQEKLDRLIEKNPHIKTLIKRFNLEID